MEWFDDYMAQIEANAKEYEAKSAENYKRIQRELGITKEDIEEAEASRAKFHEEYARNGYEADPIFF